MLAILFLIAVGWAFRDAYLHATGRLRESRQARIAEREAELAPRKMTPRQKRATAARHDTGWWWREAAHGFPVTTHGWKAGWNEHKAAHEQNRQADREQKARLAEIRKQGRQGKQSTLVTDVAPPAHSQGQQSPVPPAAPAPRPPAAGTAGSPAAGSPSLRPPEAGAQVPPASGAPQSPAGGDPAAPQSPAGPQPAAAGAPAQTPAAAAPPKSENPEPSRVPETTQGEPMPAGTEQSEYTYDQTVDTLNQIVSHAEAAQAEFDRLGIPQMTDQLSVSGLDRGNLAHISDVAAAADRVSDGYKTMIDSATTARDSIQRDHGPVAEAHQAAPEGGAEKPFYAGV